MAYSVAVIAHPSPRDSAPRIITSARSKATAAWPRQAASRSGIYGRVSARAPRSRPSASLTRRDARENSPVRMWNPAR